MIRLLRNGLKSRPLGEWAYKKQGICRPRDHAGCVASPTRRISQKSMISKFIMVVSVTPSFFAKSLILSSCQSWLFSNIRQMSLGSPDNPGGTRILAVSARYDRWFSIIRENGSSSVPHRCKCGWYGDHKHAGWRAPLQIQNYRNKIFGPLPDRIDIHIEMPSVKYQELSSIGTGEPSAAIWPS